MVYRKRLNLDFIRSYFGGTNAHTVNQSKSEEKSVQLVKGSFVPK